MAASIKSDRALIDAVGRGEVHVLQEIFDHLHPTVDRTLYRIRGCRGPEHDDWVQQAFEQLIVALSRHRRPKRCKLSTWASRAATNAGLRALESFHRESETRSHASPIHDELPISSPEPTLYLDLDGRTQLAMVRRELAMMNRDQARVLLLHDLMGHDLREIAIMFGAPLVGAESCLFQGRRELVRRLAPERLLARKGCLKSSKRTEALVAAFLATMRDLVPLEDRSVTVVRRARVIRSMANVLRSNRLMRIRRRCWLGAVGTVAVAIVLYGGWKLDRRIDVVSPAPIMTESSAGIGGR